MPSPRKEQRSPWDRTTEAFAAQLPNCEKAIHLAETGAMRPLKLHEKIALKYHGQLCPFCSCKELKFKSVLEKMHQAQKQRP